MPTPTTSTKYNAGSPRQSNQARKRNKRYLNQKKRRKIFFEDGMILYVENSKGNTTVKISKVIGYKINMQKSAYNKPSKKEIKKKSIYNSIKNQILRNKLTKDMKYLYTKNYKTLIKENKQTNKNLKIHGKISCAYSWKTILLKCSHSPK